MRSVTGVKSRLLATGRLVTGDRIGTAIFLGTICFIGLYWQSAVFINDNYTLVNGLLNVSEGRLFFESFYGPDAVSWPGTVTIDGRQYGRSYGIVFAALPILWIVSALQTVIGIRLVAVGFWCLCLLGFASRAGSLVGYRRIGMTVGGLVAAVVMAIGLVAPPIEAEIRYLLALQLLAVITTALIAVVIYRLLAYLENRTIGVFAGSVTVLATSVGYWGWIPKRHVFTGLLAIVAVYGFAVSRDGGTFGREVGHRSLAYAAAGFTAWINPAEAAVLFTVLAPLDLLTARSNGPKRLAVIGSVFGFSLVPFLATNTLITGNPLLSPGMVLKGIGGADPRTGTGSGAAAPDSGATGSPISSLAPITGVVHTAGSRLLLVASTYTDGIAILLADPGRLYEVFVIRTYTRPNAGTTRNLSILESMPFLAALVGIVPHALRRIRHREAVGSWLSDSTGTTDVFVASYVVLFTVIYLPLLPLRVQLTVRYLVPIIPGLVYLVCRLSTIRRVVQANQTAMLWTYALAVAAASFAFVAVFGFGDVIGLRVIENELIAIHGDLAVAIAAFLALATLGADRTGLEGLDRAVARLLALGAAWGTVLILVSFGHYWPGDPWLLPTL